MPPYSNKGSQGEATSILTPGAGAMRTTGNQSRLAATGDYAPSLRSPWRVTEVKAEDERKTRRWAVSDERVRAVQRPYPGRRTATTRTPLEGWLRAIAQAPVTHRVGGLLAAIRRTPVAPDQRALSCASGCTAVAPCPNRMPRVQGATRIAPPPERRSDHLDNAARWRVLARRTARTQPIGAGGRWIPL